MSADLTATTGREWNVDMVRSCWDTEGATLVPGGRSTPQATWVLHMVRMPTDLVVDTEMADVRLAIEVAERYLP